MIKTRKQSPILQLLHDLFFIIVPLLQHNWFLAQQQIFFLRYFIIQVQSHEWQFVSLNIVRL